MTRQLGRAPLGGIAAALALLGAFFVWVLVADSGDNAYLYLFFVGGALIVAAVPFAVAALTPAGSVQRAVIGVALGLLALVGLLGLALLVLSVLVIPSGNYTSNTVLINHVIALVALITSLGLIAVLYRRAAR